MLIFTNHASFLLITQIFVDLFIFSAIVCYHINKQQACLLEIAEFDRASQLKARLLGQVPSP